MIYVKFEQSFYGREDTGLTEKLLGELPGILNWALEGLERLCARGRFTEPDSGQAEAEAARRLSEPVGAFIDDWCSLEDERWISLDDLYAKYRQWCESEGRTKDSTTKEIFSKDVRSKTKARDKPIRIERKRVNGALTRICHGIGCEVTSYQSHAPSWNAF